MNVTHTISLHNTAYVVTAGTLMSCGCSSSFLTSKHCRTNCLGWSRGG